MAWANFPNVRQLGLTQLMRPAADSLRTDTIVVVAACYRQPLKASEQLRFRRWLQARLGPLPVLLPE